MDPSGLGFSDHALVRFAERAGLAARDRPTLERLLRDLLVQEGRMVSTRPRWARSRNTADGYAQVGDWLLLICRHDVRRPGALTVVTVVNGPAGMTWERAWERGLLGTPPPLTLRRPRLLAALLRRPRAIGPALRARRTALGEYDARRAEHADRRRAAAAEHRRRFG
jgi:hypothetical protein